MDTEQKLKHICEVCGKDEELTPEQSFEAGWDYPPRMGQFGIVSARTCGNCSINGTLWWALAIDKVDAKDLTESQLNTLDRILAEPASIIVSEEKGN